MDAYEASALGPLFKTGDLLRVCMYPYPHISVLSLISQPLSEFSCRRGNPVHKAMAKPFIEP